MPPCGNWWLKKLEKNVYSKKAYFDQERYLQRPRTLASQPIQYTLASYHLSGSLARWTIIFCPFFGHLPTSQTPGNLKQSLHSWTHWTIQKKPIINLVTLSSFVFPVEAITKALPCFLLAPLPPWSILKWSRISVVPMLWCSPLRNWE